MVTINNYSTQNLHADVMDKGVQKVMLHASIRPGKSMQLQVEVLDADYVKANETDVQAAVGAFILDACKQASQNGVPVTFT